MPDYVHGGTLLADAIYNVLMLCVGVAALMLVRRNRKPLACLTTLILAAIPAIFLAILFTALRGGSAFAAFRLLAWGLFLHFPLVLFGFAAILFRHRRWWSLTAAAAGLLIVAVGCDAFFIEPAWLEVTEVDIVSAKVSGPVRIAVVADLQTDRFGSYERKALRQVMESRPDVILLAGDYLQCGDLASEQRLRRALREYLKEIKLSAPLGVYAVRGNVDPSNWSDTFAGLPITVIDQTQSIDMGGLTVSGLSCEDSFNGGADLPPTDQYHIVLGHSPNFALAATGGDLLVAGHTHGGQVRLPGIGPLLSASRVPRSWAAGRTDLGDGRVLIVSRGVGHERGDSPRLRFLCRPELVIITIRPQS
jgi:predicted MPP superfamily phosphohydrolase